MMKTIPLTPADLDRLARILKNAKSGTVLAPGQREMLAIAYQVAIAEGVVIPPQLDKVAKALQFDRVIV
jgi:hypothetical protein